MKPSARLVPDAGEPLKDKCYVTAMSHFYRGGVGRIMVWRQRLDVTTTWTISIMGNAPMKRFGEARELIGATLLLASDAGGFITGTELVVDGGFSAMSL